MHPRTLLFAFLVPAAFAACTRTPSYEGDEQGECKDGADNDQNGLFDCDDPGCEGSPECGPSFEDTGDDTGEAADRDEDGSPDDEDCQPADPEISPLAEEIPYDGKNNDCDPTTPDDDLDGDGEKLATDCDDTDPTISPREEESPWDGIDNDCDAATPDDDLDGDGLVLDEDCDDSDPTVGQLSGVDCLQAARVHTLQGDTRDATLGTAVQAVGDLDGDGISELAVGAAGRDRQLGAVYLLSGADLAAGGGLDSAVATWTGTARYDFVGDTTRLPIAGDIDGDGLADVAVAQPNADPGGFSNAGEVAVFLSSDPNLAGTGELSSRATVLLRGRSTGDKHGSGVAFVDLDGDGLPEAIVGSPYDDLAYNNAGAVAIHSGASLTPGERSITDADVLITGQFSENFGAGAILGLGDITGDGLDDLAVGSTLSDGVEVDSGVVYVFTGSALDSRAALALATVRIEGTGYDDAFGYGLAPLGDLDGDGESDFVVGALQGDGAVTNSGTASLFLGGPELSGVVGADTAVATLGGTTGLARTGAEPIVEDIESDGILDIVLSEPFGATSGRVFFLPGSEGYASGAPADTASVWLTSSRSDAFGTSLAVADLDGTGDLDVVVGAPDAPGDEGELAGAVSVFLR